MTPSADKYAGLFETSCLKRQQVRRENTIDPQVQLAETLVRARLVTESDVLAARGADENARWPPQRQPGRDGRRRCHFWTPSSTTFPRNPPPLRKRASSDSDLLALFMKLVYAGRLEKIGTDRRRNQASPAHRDGPCAHGHRAAVYLYARRARNRQHARMRYALTDEGKRWTIDALRRSGYIGPAPVPFDKFIDA